ncbi:MAG: aldo/keto reductase [Candidatus Omnitrophica bacterium]|nr:aldo/keto reductase [Candidatus Omnitrophota bacterium]MBU1128667.1 aldo/keto reductase [Candidatus Omnitrophota bacterium]MBU1784904.1 aldo/keto reductase [Candidatus Omnitrophota bacterium]MBU1852203.1 aldo/keto reductase [Candidatus Omnitrophota bacterium]
MKYRRLGHTDLEISVVALGTWVFGGDCWGEVDDEISVSVVHKAIDSGINMIDTAPIYGSGRSESVIGRAIKGKRQNVVIATKCGLKGAGASIKVDLSAGFIRKDIEASLKRLDVETIDLYQCHWPDEKTPFEETFGELQKLIKEGKIRYIGVSNFDKDLLTKALGIAPVVSDQMQYSLFDRSIEKDLMPACSEKNVSVLAYGPLGGGILSGKYKKPPQIPKTSVKSFFYKFYREPFWSKGKELVAVLEEIAAARGKAVSECAINWVLSHSEVASCIVGCRTPEQVRMNAPDADWELSPEELGRIQEKYENIFGS